MMNPKLVLKALSVIFRKDCQKKHITKWVSAKGFDKLLIKSQGLTNKEFYERYGTLLGGILFSFRYRIKSLDG